MKMLQGQSRHLIGWLVLMMHSSVFVRTGPSSCGTNRLSFATGITARQQHVEAGVLPPEALVRAQEALRAIEQENFDGGFDVGAMASRWVYSFSCCVAADGQGVAAKGNGLLQFIAEAKGIEPEQVRNVIEAAISEENSPTTQSRVNYETGDPLTIPPPEFTVPKELQEAIDLFNRAMPDEAKSNIFSKQRRDSTSTRAERA